MRRVALVLLAAGLVPGARLTAQRAYRLGPLSAWVRPLPVPLDSPAPAERVTNGYEMLLDDRQERVGAGAPEAYQHIAYRLLDEGAVQDYSQIEIVFDSSYERVTLHAVRLFRNGRWIDQLQPRRIRVVQRESRVDYQIYDGSLSLVLLMEDVRRGDVVEYGYSRMGANPVFGAHYMRAMAWQRTVPLRRKEFRLLWPRDRRLFIHGEGTVEPQIRRAGNEVEYLWRVSDVPPRVVESDLPSWYEPFPSLQLSDFASWAAVAAWGDSLFDVAASPPPSLAASLARIRSAHPTPAARVLAALRFVQDEVRYLGVEIGVNSHQPYPPAVVMRRRYGDCKDKALLLTVMLRALGVPARPALVSTDYGAHIRDVQPTAQAFDHAIVEAEVDGRPVWLDATALYQRGDLAAVTPGFGAALVLGGVDSLMTIPDEGAAHPLTDITVTLDLHAVDSAAAMRVVTRYVGPSADGMRSTTRTSSREELERRFQDYYADLYPAIRSESPPEVQDDEAGDTLRTVERYRVPEFWHESSDGQGLIGTFEPLELSGAIPSATGVVRTMPLAVEYPVHVRYTIEADLEQGWNIRPRSETIETPAARFIYRARAEGRRLTLRWEYETLADHVSADHAAEHLARMARARKLLVFSVTPPDTTAPHATWADPGEMNWPVLLTALLTLGIALVTARWLSSRPAPAWPRGPEGTDGPTGLGGWLVLVGIGVTLGPLSALGTIVGNASAYTASTWAALTMPGGTRYHPLWAPALLLELVINLSLLVFGALLAWQFFRRRRWFPALFVVFILARTLLTQMDSAFVHAIPDAEARAAADPSARTVGTIVGSLVWVAYMFRSRRVRNTFVT